MPEDVFLSSSVRCNRLWLTDQTHLVTGPIDEVVIRLSGVSTLRMLQEKGWELKATGRSEQAEDSDDTLQGCVR